MNMDLEMSTYRQFSTASKWDMINEYVQTMEVRIIQPPSTISKRLAGTEIILKIYFVPQRYEVRVNIDTSQIYTERGEKV